MPLERRPMPKCCLRNNIGIYRVQRGLSLDELSRSVGRRKDTVRGWESGRRMPHLVDLFRLSHALGVIPEALYHNI